MAGKILEIGQGLFFLVLMIGALCVLFIIFPTLKTGDAAAWVQAIGSVAAIVAAIWISSNTDRKRQDQELMLARVTAAAILFNISGMSGKIKAVVDLLDDLKVGGGTFHDLPICNEMLGFRRKFDLKDLANLVPLLNNCAFKIAGGIDRLDSGIALLQDAISDPRTAADLEHRKYQASMISFVLNEAALLLGTADTLIQLEVMGHTSPYHQSEAC